MPLHLSLPETSADPQADVAAVAPESTVRWLDELAYDDPLRTGRAVADRLGALNAQRLRITLRQDLNEHFFPVVQRLLAILERQLGSGELPLAPDARAASKVADDLIAQLAASYKSLLVEQSRRLFGFASSGRALLPIQRTMLLIGQRLVLSYRIYATAPKGVWSELHELYQFAARRGLSQRELDPSSPTPLALYKSALMTAFADPQRLAPGDLNVVLALVHELANRAQIGLAQDRRNVQGIFVIKPQRDTAGYSVSKRHQPSPQTHDLVLNTLPVAEGLVEKLARLDGKTPLADLGLPADTDLVRAKDLLGRLIKYWGAVPNRRFNRLRTHAKVEITVGLADIWAFLNEGGVGEAGAGEWMVTNESPRGFALMHVSGAITPVRVGEVVGLRARETPGCHICVVRWVLSDNPEHLELGLEEIAPTARPAKVRRVRDSAGTMVPALLLPEVPNHNQAASILAPLASMDQTCELSIGELQAKLKVRPTQTVERTPSVQLVEFASVE